MKYQMLNMLLSNGKLESNCKYNKVKYQKLKIVLV